MLIDFACLRVLLLHTDDGYGHVEKSLATSNKIREADSMKNEDIVKGKREKERGNNERKKE